MGAIEDHGYTFKADVSGDAADGYVKRRDGAVVGELNTAYDDGTDTYVVLLSILDSTVPKGKGIGADLYTRLAAEVKAKTGKRLSSEKKLQSQSAARMWQRLVSQGQAQGPVKMGSKEMYVTEDDKLHGGLADKRKPSEFDPDQLDKGIEHELEHTDDRDLAREIAMDHLSEDPRYYDHLKESMKMRNVLFEMFGVKTEKPKLGSGQRFKQLTTKLAAQGATDPAALAATIGRKKHGASKMAKMAADGRKHEGLNESEDLLSQFEDNYPDGLCPKKWIVKLFKTHGMPDADAAWREYAQETGAPPTMPEQVEWQPVLSWMGY